jgi:hypothetical protein
VLTDPGEAEAALLGKFDRGEVTGDHLILERYQDDPAVHFTVPAAPGEVRYLTRRYPGAGRIPDLLAANLFRRFAAPYYAKKEHADTLDPFVYRAERYVGARVPPADDTWGYPDPDGVRQLQEMRFLVVQFFLHGIPDTPEEVVGAGVAAAAAERETARRAWLDLQPVGTEVDERTPAADIAATRAVEAWHAALAAVTPPPDGSPVARELAELRLHVALTDLNLDIHAYVLLAGQTVETADLAGDRDAAAVLREVEDGQAAVDAAWMLLLSQAGDQQDRIIATFDKAVDAALRWKPGAAWVWYGPDQ